MTQIIFFATSRGPHKMRWRARFGLEFDTCALDDDKRLAWECEVDNKGCETRQNILSRM